MPCTRPRHGFLGLGMQTETLDDGQEITVVMAVDPMGPAGSVSIYKGDRIVALNGKPIQGVRSLLAEIGPDTIGSTVTLSLRRKGFPVDVEITVRERPAA